MDTSLNSSASPTQQHHPHWDGIHHTQTVEENTHRVLSENPEVDTALLILAEKIPYYSWGGALNTNGMQVIENLQGANYSTIIALGRHFSIMPEGYWNDMRDRNFDGIAECMTTRLQELGYRVTQELSRKYKNQSEERVFRFPIECEKISSTPSPVHQSPSVSAR